MFTPEKLQCLLETFPKDARFWVAYSGGLDSQVLLYALSQLFPKNRLRALHINHGWHADSYAWANLCKKTCERLGIYCEVIVVDAKPKAGESAEACARKARYAAIAQRIPRGDYLLTAHHLDDQTETLLLQLLRGAGIRGLASMPVCQSFAQANLLRPLLNFTRSELYSYAQKQKLVWIEDSSNRDIRFNRNFIRHKVLPIIHQRWPKFNKTLARSAGHIAEAHHLLEELAYEDWQKINNGIPNILSISNLLRLSVGRRRNVLRYWFSRLNFPMPSQGQLRQVEYLLGSKIDAVPQVCWGDVQLRRYRDDLYALRLADDPPLLIPATPWVLNREVLDLPKLGILTAERVLGQGLACSTIKEASVKVDFRQGGERFYSNNRLSSHPLKKLFQEWGVPPWQRNKTPLIYYQNELVAIVGYAIHPRFIASQHELGYVIKLLPNADHATAGTKVPASR